MRSVTAVISPPKDLITTSETTLDFCAQSSSCYLAFLMRQGAIKCAAFLCCPQLVLVLMERKYTESKARGEPCQDHDCPRTVCICGASMLGLSPQTTQEASRDWRPCMPDLHASAPTLTHRPTEVKAHSAPYPTPGSPNKPSVSVSSPFVLSDGFIL